MARYRGAIPQGCVGPRGNGYVDGATMSAEEAEEYHARQIGVFAESDADMTTAITMAYAQEAVGVARAAVAAGIRRRSPSPSRPTGGPERAAPRRGDRAGRRRHRRGPGVLHDQLRPSDPLRGGARPDVAWPKRIHGLRLNASTRSHAEFDEAEELDEGNPEELGAQYRALRDALPAVSVLGGCWARISAMSPRSAACGSRPLRADRSGSPGPAAAPAPHMSRIAAATSRGGPDYPRGLKFWLRRNRLVGSYLVLSATRRS